MNADGSGSTAGGNMSGMAPRGTNMTISSTMGSTTGGVAQQPQLKMPHTIVAPGHMVVPPVTVMCVEGGTAESEPCLLSLV
jgi:hypothetical protein